MDDLTGLGELLDLDILDQAANLGPLQVVDGGDDLEIWRASALEAIRDTAGRIVDHSTPGTYTTTDQVAEWTLNSWRRGDDPTDDERRRVARLLCAAVNALPVLLAEIDRLTAPGHIMVNRRDLAAAVAVLDGIPWAARDGDAPLPNLRAALDLDAAKERTT